MRATISSLIFGLSTLLFCCSSEKRTQPGADNFSRYKDSLQTSLDSFSVRSLIPGFAVAVVGRNGIEYEKGFGWAQLERKIPFDTMTIHWQASISKTIVALSVMQMVESGRLQLDEPVNNILPYPIIHPHFPNIPITVRHLLTHTSGLIDDAFVPYYIGESDICLVNDSRKWDCLPEYLQPNLAYYRMGKRISLDEHIRLYGVKGGRWYTDSSFATRSPGTYFQYANLNFAVAARIVEILSGYSFADYTQKFIFQPLQMFHTAWDFDRLDTSLCSAVYAYDDPQKPQSVVEHPQYYMTNFAASGLKSTTGDMARYLLEMIRGSSGTGHLLRPENFQSLFATQPLVDNFNRKDSSFVNNHFAIALAWSVTAGGLRLHFGGNTGVYSFIYFDPAVGTGALGFCNLRDPGFADLLGIVYRYERLMHGPLP